MFLTRRVQLVLQMEHGENCEWPNCIKADVFGILCGSALDLPFAEFTDEKTARLESTDRLANPLVLIQIIAHILKKNLVPYPLNT